MVVNNAFASINERKHVDVRTRTASGEQPLTEIIVTNLTGVQASLFKDMTIGTFRVKTNTHGPVWGGDEAPLNYLIVDGVTTAEKNDIKIFLDTYRDCFAKDMAELGTTFWAELEINTGTAAPVRCTPWRVSHAQKDIIKGQIKEMLKIDIIEP